MSRNAEEIAVCGQMHGQILLEQPRGPCANRRVLPHVTMSGQRHNCVGSNGEGHQARFPLVRECGQTTFKRQSCPELSMSGRPGKNPEEIRRICWGLGWNMCARSESLLGLEVNSFPELCKTSRLGRVIYLVRPGTKVYRRNRET